MKTILIIAPHADDEILGCGGVIAKHTNEGNKVIVLVVTNASVGAPDLYSTELITSLRKEAITAHKSLAVSASIFLDFPAPNLINHDGFRVSIEISRVVSQVQPEIVFLPHPSDLHTDHKAVYQSALVALRPNDAPTVKEIYCYETLSESEWAPHQGIRNFQPNVFIDISSCIESKLKAMSFYVSQLKEFPHSRSLKTIESLSQYRGATIGVSNAEAFELVRFIS